MAYKSNAIVKAFWRIHPKVYRWSAGRIGGSMMGLPVLLLTTRGKKSGLLRTKALMYLPRGQDFVVIASNLGDDHHPAWWLNLQAEPSASVQVGSQHYPIQARQAEGAEREEIWNELTARVSIYNQYQGMTTRHIPVVVLERMIK